MRSLKMVWRLYLPYLLITLVSLLVLGWFSFSSMRDFYLSQTAADLEVRTELLGPDLSASLALLRAETTSWEGILGCFFRNG